jgi:spore maturation protein CgeB
MGYCPSGRLFEAAACATPVLSDGWEGLEAFFEPEREILLARDTNDSLEAIALPADQLRRIGQRARQRAIEEHSFARRARELEDILSAAWSRKENSGAALTASEAGT